MLPNSECFILNGQMNALVRLINAWHNGRLNTLVRFTKCLGQWLIEHTSTCLIHKLFWGRLNKLVRKKQVDWTIRSMLNNVYSGTHKNEARSTNKVENKACRFQRKIICPLYQILSDVRFNTVSIITGGKDSKLNLCSHRKMRTTSPWPSG